MELSGTWRAAVADEDLRRTLADDRPRRRRRGSRSRCPGHWRSTPAFADARRPAALPPPLRGTPRPADGERAWLALRRPLLPRRRLARRRLPRRHRGLLRPPHLRGDRGARATGTEHLLARRGHLRAADATAPPSATSPASSSTGTASTPTGTPAASGGRCASSDRARPHPRTCGCCAGEADATSGPSSPCGPMLDSAPSPRRSSLQHHGRRRRPRAEQPLAAGENQRRVDGHGRPSPRSGGRGPSATSRSRRHRRGRPRTAPTGRATGAPCRTGLRQVAMRRLDRARSTASASSSRARTTGPTRMALGEATADELRRDVAPRQRRRPRPPPRPRPRQPARALRRGRRGRACSCGRTCPCSGATPAASASRRSARRAPPSTCSATTRRSRSGAATTSRWPSTLEPGDDPADWRAVAAGSLRGQQLPTWNKTVLDRSIKRALEQGRRHPPGHRPLRRAPPPAAARRHRHATSTSAGTTATSATSPAPRRPCPAWRASSTEFGAQAVPDTADFCEPERWPDLDWDRLGRHPRPPEGRLRPARAARRLRHVRRRGRTPRRRYQADARQAPRRGAAPPQVPPHRRLRPVLLRRRPPRGHVVGARPRAARRRPGYDGAARRRAAR